MNLTHEQAVISSAVCTYIEKSEDVLLYADQGQITQILINCKSLLRCNLCSVLHYQTGWNRNRIEPFPPDYADAKWFAEAGPQQ